MIDANIPELEERIKQLTDLEKKHLPFAMARAYTQTAQKVQSALVAQADFKIDKPTPYTKKGFAIQAANKRDRPAPYAIAYIRPGQAEYMQWIIDGGTRYPERRALAVPQAIRKNRYGNIPRGKIKKLLADKPEKYFSGIPKGSKSAAAGLWERYAKDRKTKQFTKIRLAVAYEPSAQYQQTFPYWKIGFSVVNSVIGKITYDSLDIALKDSF